MTPYYQDDAVTIYHGDCREVLPYWHLADVLVTDPPYGIHLNNDWQNAVHAKNKTANNWAVGGIDGDTGSDDWVGLCGLFSNRLVFGYPYLLDTSATGWLVWDKEPGFNGKSLTSPVEMAYTTFWKGFRCERLLWSGYMRAPGSEAKFGHPTQKPEQLLRSIIAKAPAGDVVDPFMGSGTTLRAAKDLGRKAIGVELDERYCEIAANRMGQEVLDLGVSV